MPSKRLVFSNWRKHFECDFEVSDLPHYPKMGNSSTINERICVCENLIDNDNWIICDKCFKWFHAICVLSSTDEYDRIINNNENWICKECVLNESITELKITNEKPSSFEEQKELNRTLLPRKCKQSKIQSQSIAVTSTNDEGSKKRTNKSDGNKDLLDRVVCNCGFIAKNYVGLRIHWGKKKKKVNSQISKIDQSTRMKAIEKETDLKEYLNDFNLLLGKCKKSIPITRIIQKSVRIIVCQDLTTLVNEVVQKMIYLLGYVY